MRLEINLYFWALWIRNNGLDPEITNIGLIQTIYNSLKSIIPDAS